MGALSACPYLTLFFLHFKPQLLQLGSSEPPPQGRATQSHLRRGCGLSCSQRGGTLWLLAECGSGCPDPPEAKTQGRRAARREVRQRDCYLWVRHPPGSSSLLIHSPFIREELEVREEKMLMVPVVSPEAVYKFSISLCCPQGSGLVSVWVLGFPQAVTGQSR